MEVGRRDVALLERGRLRSRRLVGRAGRVALAKGFGAEGDDGRAGRGVRVRKVRGWTITEILVVISILAILAALTFNLSAPMREAGRQRVCATQLQQIHRGHMLYASDHPGAEEVPGLTGWAAASIKDTRVIHPYLKDRSILQCPNLSPAARRVHPSYYAGTIDLHPPRTERDRLEDPDYEARLQRSLARIERLGPAYPVYYCGAHEETYYRPRRGEIHPDFEPAPLVVQLLADGSVRTVHDPEAVVGDFLKAEGVL